MEIEINGIKYKQIETSTPKMPKGMRSVLTMSMLLGGMGAMGGGSRKRTQTPNVDIVKEYELIQQKKSNLSASQRRQVVARFESNFKRVDK